MNNERITITLFTVFVIVASFLYMNHDHSTRLFNLEATQELNEMKLNPLCADTLLREPGGLSHTVAVVCYNEHGWARFNTNRLTEEQYERLIKPLDDRVREMARQEGIYRSRYYD